MVKKKGHSFDAMVKFFMKNYEIPTLRDVEKLMARMDQLERRIINLSAYKKKRNSTSDEKPESGEKAILTAIDVVYDVIKDYDEGVRFKEIHMQTGFEEKKIRNIIYRLSKMERITRISRGLYRVS